MVKVSPRDIESRLTHIGDPIRVVLLYGPDQGRALSYGRRIARQIVADMEDPFLVTRPTPAKAKDNPALLVDEINAVPMMGGRKLIRYDFSGSATDLAAQVMEPVRLVLAGGKGDGVLIVTVGDIRASHALVKLCEKAETALVIACYADEARDLESLVRQRLTQAGLGIDPAAVRFLGDHLGGDRAVTLGELDKIILYKGKDKSPVTLEQVEALVGDSSRIMLADIAAAVTGGDTLRLERCLAKAEIAGEQPVAILRTVQIRIQRLYQVRVLMQAGASEEDALKSLQPPLFWKDRGPFRHSLGQWPLPKLSRAILLLFDTEVSLKTTGNPTRTLLARSLLQLAGAAGRERI